MERKEIIDNFYKQATAGLNVKILQDNESWYSYISNLSAKLQVTYTIVIFNQQVINGGLHQYFFNSFGQFGYLTLINLKLIKAYETAEILERALNEINVENFSNSIFRKKIYNREFHRIIEIPNDLGNILDELDEKYYSLEEDLEVLIFDFYQSQAIS